MVATSNGQVKHLITRELLATAAAHGTGIDARGMSFLSPRCEDRAAIRAQVEGLRAFHLDGARWVCSSGSRPSEGYVLYAYDHGKITCNCDAGTRGAKTCKHRELVRRLAADRLAIAQAVHEGVVGAHRQTIAAQAAREGKSELAVLVG